MVLKESSRGALNHQLTTVDTKRLLRCTQSDINFQDNSSPCLRITRELLEGFENWLRNEQGTSNGTIRKYMYYLPKIEGLTLCGKQDVGKVFQLMRLTKVSYEAFSRLLTYIEKKTSHEELALSLRRALPRKPKSREDTYVPPDDKIKTMSKCLEKYGEAYMFIHFMLTYTGARFEEVLWLFKNKNEVRPVNLDYNAVRLHLPSELQRGSKRAYTMYMPLWLWNKIRAYNGDLHNPHTIKRRFRACGLAVKYYRKWWRQKAKELGVDSETIEAFQGRPVTVGGRHYTDWIPILDKEYKRILEYLDSLLKGDSN